MTVYKLLCTWLSGVAFLFHSNYTLQCSEAVYTADCRRCHKADAVPAGTVYLKTSEPSIHHKNRNPRQTQNACCDVKGP